jgi:hypothetical protein
MTSKQTPLYIGWNDQMELGHKKWLRIRILVLIVGAFAISMTAIFYQKSFNDHVFEYGQVKEFQGVYHSNPVPILSLTSNAIPPNHDGNALLVGYGKFGAKGIFNQIEREHGQLEGRLITLKGTLIYGDGKILIELTDEENSLVQADSVFKTDDTNLDSFQKLELSGEIIDPKCYFGVMKPGDGKIHKSCAIRCISGGIPPVFKVTNAKGSTDYFLLLNQKGDALNKHILSFVGEKVNVSGLTRISHGWRVLYIDINSII